MKPLHHFPLFATAVIAFALPASSATWTGATSGSWSTSTNWTGTPPDNVTAQAIVYDSTSTTNLTQTLNASYTVTGITFTSPTGAVTVNSGTGTGNTLTIGSGGIDMSSATQNLTLSNSLTVGTTQSWTVGTGRTLQRTGATTTFGTSTITTFSGAGIVDFTGAQTLTGAGNIVVDGASLYNNLQSGSSSAGFSGTTTLNSGIIRISTSISMFGTGAINLNGGAIGSFNTTGRIIGSNNVNIGGNFQVGGSSPLSTGFIRFDGATDLGGAVREITAIATGVNSGFGSGAIFTGIVANGGITKAGAGIMTLTNDGNTFSGATTINAGNLAVSNGALANSSSVTLANSSAVLSLGINGTTTVKNFSGVSGSQVRTDFNISGGDGARTLSVNQTTAGEFAGSFTQGTGGRTISLIKTGSAALTMSGTGGYTGGTTLAQGSLIVTAANALGSSGTVTINSAATGSANTSLFVNGNVTFARAITVANEGSGVTTLGTSALSAGNQAIFTGAITMNKDMTLQGVSGGDRTQFSGGISGTGHVTVSGSGRVILIGTANTYNGFTTINGTLQLSDGTSTTTSFIPDSSAVTVSSGAFLRLAKGGNSETIGALSGSGTVEALSGNDTLIVGNGNATSNFGGVLKDNGAQTLALTKTGSGTLTLSGASSFTGATQVSAGTLLVNGSLGNTAVTVGTAGTFGGSGSLGGNLELDATSIFQVVDFNDPLNVAGTITFGSGFGIANLPGFDWDALDLDSPYTLVSTTQTFGISDIANFGYNNRVAVGALGREAYFTNGSLAVIVIPEPQAALLGGLSLLVLMRRRR